MLEALGPRVVGLQESAVTCMGTRVMVTLCEPVPKVAVTVAD